MHLSVVISVLNGRSELPATLDSLAEVRPSAEIIVVNGPSSDGTSGFARSHDTVDTVLELSDRNPNVARNAGIAGASGDAIAFLGQGMIVETGWLEGVETALGAGSDAVTGPIHRAQDGDVTTEAVAETTVGSRNVRFFDAGNVVFSRDAIVALDGFDEHLPVGGARDVAHRLARLGRTLRWESDVSVRRTSGRIDYTESPGASRNLEYRARSYRMAKNYGLGFRTVRRLSRSALSDGIAAVKAMGTEGSKPSTWLQTGREALIQFLRGIAEGLRARRSDTTRKRNPNGLSARSGRPVSSCSS